VNERLRMTLLSPGIIESILNGTQPEDLTINWLTRNSFSNNWSQQVFIKTFTIEVALSNGVSTDAGSGTPPRSSNTSVAMLVIEGA